jgi:hypothetical protein
MAFLGQAFNPQEVAPSVDLQPLPSGEYPAMIVDSQMKPTKTPGGQYLELVYQVIDGPMKGRMVWSRLNLVNKSPKAVEIAQRDLSAICAAVNETNLVNDSAVLHNRPHLIRVEFVPADYDAVTKPGGNRKDGNEVAAYKRLDGAPATMAPIVPAGTNGALPLAGGSGGGAAGAAAPAKPTWAGGGPGQQNAAA